MKELKQFGVIGLGVMGRNLALNLLDKGIKLSVYNRIVPGIEEEIASKFAIAHPQAAGFDDLKAFVLSLQKPRKILIMIQAGMALDQVIGHLLPHLEPGDLLIDGGNSHFEDTVKRLNDLTPRGILYLGTGISGGEEGARNGAAIMPGGSAEGYNLAAPYLESIAAKDKSGKPCCAYVGPGGAGHFVKMVHNGIEYAEMQIFAEMYQVMRYQKKMSPEEMADTFEQWNDQGQGSFLIEITRDILRKKEGDNLLLDKILDAAEQKGTGGWSSKAALDLGIPLTTISEAVAARIMSSRKILRERANELYKIGRNNSPDPAISIDQLKNTCYAARIINHSIGFDLIHQASLTYHWNLKLGELARIWTNGCIIRSGLMQQLVTYLDTVDQLLMHPEIADIMKQSWEDLARVVSEGVKHGNSLPVLSSSLNYFLGYTAAASPANLIQAQRDYFGAHTYRRIDSGADQYFHTNWKE